MDFYMPDYNNKTCFTTINNSQVFPAVGCSSISFVALWEEKPTVLNTNVWCEYTLFIIITLCECIPNLDEFVVGNWDKPQECC